MSKLHEIHAEVGQSIWLDYIGRSLINSGELKQMIDDGLRGMTSNPTIFAEAIGESRDYDENVRRLAKEGKAVEEIYEAIAIADVRSAADLFLPIYKESDFTDGFVSLEVNPNLAYDTEGAIEEARRLFAQVNRPNVMIKVPATEAGIPAIATLIGEGININVTLMFSLAHYEAVSDAYLQGMESLIEREVDLGRVASVASFFVSRIDTQVDEQLEARGEDKLLGQIGIANAKMAYARYLTVFSSPRWLRLAKLGAHPQRILFGSTSVKNPAYPETMYVDNLMGANTINTLPRQTIQATQAAATVTSGLTANLEEARRQLVRLGQLGINLEKITADLQAAGVHKFAKSFDELTDAIHKKSA
ncbi:MAG: transaldolase [Caldilineaceae bacterium]